MIHTVRPVVAPAIPLFLALLSVLALGVVNVARAQTVTLGLSSTSIAENGGTATVTATVSPASTTPFTVEISATATPDAGPSMDRITVSGTTLNFAANATVSTGTVTITAIDNDGHTPQLRGGVSVKVSGTVTGGTSVTDPSNETLAIVEDDGIGTATDMTRPEAIWPRSTVDGDRVVLVFSEALKSDRTPRAIQFHVTIDSGPIVRLRTVEVRNHRVFLTLREPVGSDAAVSIGYNVPKDDNLDIYLARALQDLVGNPVYRSLRTLVVNVTKPRVELVLTPSSIDEDGGESVVTARVAEASMTAFTVEVAVAPVAPATADDFTVSSNTVLSFAANATESTGEVTITAVDNGEIEDDLEVTVSGAVTGTSDVLEPMDETLTIRDDDRSEPGNVELVLTPGSIDENGGESVVTARVAEASMTAFTVEVAVAPVAPATADDFTVSSNKVLSFAANATESTGEVTIAAIDNEEADGKRAVTVSGTVTGTSDVSEPMDETLTIRDDDKPEPSDAAAIHKAWLARFGRIAAQHVLDGVRDRLTAPREAGLRGRIAGQAFNGAAPPSDRLRNVPDDAAASNPFRSRSVTDRDLLTGTAFALTGATGDGGSGALWGRGGHSRFDGRDGAIRLDGRVTVATFGADYSAGRWLAGLALSRSRGEGSYRRGTETGKLTSSLTGVYPYVRCALTERLSLWGAAGHGRGTLRMTPARQPTAGTDISFSMAGAGARGVLLPRKQRAGLELALGADALYAGTASEAMAGLKGPDANARRLLLRLEGSWVQPFEGGATLTPSLEIGVRHDGGDAETGFGADVGGGIAWADSRSGFSLALNARGLLVHEASGFREWGVSGALRYDPDPVSERGLSLTLTPSWGAASTGGADALFGRETLAGLSRDETRPRDARLGLKFAYGFSAVAGRFTGTPYLGLALTTQGGRDVRIGWRLAAARRDAIDMTFGLEAARREDAGDDPEHTAGLRLTTRW